MPFVTVRTSDELETVGFDDRFLARAAMRRRNKRRLLLLPCRLYPLVHPARKYGLFVPI